MTPNDALAATVAAITVILSVIVSLVGSSARRQSVTEHRATAQDLCELTGITQPRDLQDAFGPPGMDRIWRTVTLAEVTRERRPLGHLLSDDRLDYLCGAVALMSFFWRNPLILLFLGVALCFQVAGWVVSSRLPR